MRGPAGVGEYHPDDQVSFADLADQAFLNIRRALGSGRAAEASTWMRVYERLAHRARSEVMAELPDIKPPLLEAPREPLKLAAAASETCEINNLTEQAVAEPQPLDSLDSVSPESNPLTDSLLPLGEGGREADGSADIVGVSRRTMPDAADPHPFA